MGRHFDLDLTVAGATRDRLLDEARQGPATTIIPDRVVIFAFCEAAGSGGTAAGFVSPKPVDCAA